MAKLRNLGETAGAMNVSGNMHLHFGGFIETDARKNSSRKAPAEVESNLQT